MISRLQAKVKELTETQGLNVEPSLHDDLVTVMDQHENEVTKQHDENSFQMLFLETATTSFEKWCLYLHHCSSRAYKMLNSNVYAYHQSIFCGTIPILILLVLTFQLQQTIS